MLKCYFFLRVQLGTLLSWTKMLGSHQELYLSNYLRFTLILVDKV
jgi:hypothetical protein